MPGAQAFNAFTLHRPDHALIEQRTGEWAEQFRIGSPALRRHLVTHDIGTFAARILPGGEPQVVQIPGDFVLWLFGVDDGHCEEGDLGRNPEDLAVLSAGLLRIVQNPEVPTLGTDPLAAGLRDLRRRIDVHATPGRTARWVDALREYFFSVIWEASYRKRNGVACLDAHTLMRLYDGATSVIPPLLEMGHGYELDSLERDSTAVRAATEMAYSVITWDNDIFSHHKECRSGLYYLDAVRVLEREYGLTTAEALTEAIRQRDHVLVLFEEPTATLRRQGSPRLRTFLGSLADFIRGAQDWGISSLRYTTPDDPAALPDVFERTPQVSRSAPLGIPSIDWWWDQLPGRGSRTTG
ncbi:selina-4(15),7(11)-diene synthase [Streptomyces monticola]|uniref:Selina-4(15),7(11)-diene synthase n=1 Tax=Streptomyces monticola TaxID=2666263 RepID=A0ABW2JNM2_9ACTN